MNNTKQPAVIMVESRQQRNDPQAFKTVAVTTIVTTDEYGSHKLITRRVEFGNIDAYVARQVARYAVKPSSPHADQITGLRALRVTLS